MLPLTYARVAHIRSACRRGTDRRQSPAVFIPKGFAHGFAVLSETAIFQYKCDEFYHPEADGGISILDDSLGIDWRIPTEHAILSEKDTKHPLLKDFESPFIYK